MRLKKAINVLVFLLLFSLLFPLSAYAIDFSDVTNGYWAYREINEMSDSGTISGFPDGNFRPENPITRAEFATIVVKGLNLPVTSDSQSSFTDVSTKHWAMNYIQTASKAGFINGYNGKFRPNDKISREEMASIFMRISEKYGYSGGGATSILYNFKDGKDISEWAKQDVADAIKFGYIEATSYLVKNSIRTNQVLSPLTNATRAQASFGLYKLLKKTAQM